MNNTEFYRSKADVGIEEVLGRKKKKGVLGGDSTRRLNPVYRGIRFVYFKHTYLKRDDCQVDLYRCRHKNNPNNRHLNCNSMIKRRVEDGHYKIQGKHDPKCYELEKKSQDNTHSQKPKPKPKTPLVDSDHEDEDSYSSDEEDLDEEDEEDILNHSSGEEDVMTDENKFRGGGVRVRKSSSSSQLKRSGIRSQPGSTRKTKFKRRNSHPPPMSRRFYDHQNGGQPNINRMGRPGSSRGPPKNLSPPRTRRRSERLRKQGGSRDVSPPPPNQKGIRLPHRQHNNPSAFQVPPPPHLKNGNTLPNLPQNNPNSGPPPKMKVFRIEGFDKSMIQHPGEFVTCYLHYPKRHPIHKVPLPQPSLQNIKIEFFKFASDQPNGNSVKIFPQFQHGGRYKKSENHVVPTNPRFLCSLFFGKFEDYPYANLRVIFQIPSFFDYQNKMNGVYHISITFNSPPSQQMNLVFFKKDFFRFYFKKALRHPPQQRMKPNNQNNNQNKTNGGGGGNNIMFYHDKVHHVFPNFIDLSNLQKKPNPPQMDRNNANANWNFHQNKQTTSISMLGGQYVEIYVTWSYLLRRSSGRPSQFKVFIGKTEVEVVLVKPVQVKSKMNNMMLVLVRLPKFRIFQCFRDGGVFDIHLIPMSGQRSQFDDDLMIKNGFAFISSSSSGGPNKKTTEILTPMLNSLGEGNEDELLETPQSLSSRNDVLPKKKYNPFLDGQMESPKKSINIPQVVQPMKDEEDDEDEPLSPLTPGFGGNSIQKKYLEMMHNPTENPIVLSPIDDMPFKGFNNHSTGGGMNNNNNPNGMMSLTNSFGGGSLTNSLSGSGNGFGMGPLGGMESSSNLNSLFNELYNDPINPKYNPFEEI